MPLGQPAKQIFVHEHIVRDYNATAALVLGNMYFLIAKHGESRQSLKSQSIRTRISPNTVRRWINRFIDDGLIRVIPANTASGVVYHLGANASLEVFEAYQKLILKTKRQLSSRPTGALVTINNQDIPASKGKKSEALRFKAYLRAYCIDKIASSGVGQGRHTFGYVIGSVRRFASKLGITRQTLAKLLRELRSATEVRVESFEGTRIIDFMTGLDAEVRAKHKKLSSLVYR